MCKNNNKDKNQNMLGQPSIRTCTFFGKENAFYKLIPYCFHNRTFFNKMLFPVFTTWSLLCVWVFDNSYVHHKQALSVHEIHVEQ